MEMGVTFLLVVIAFALAIGIAVFYAKRLVEILLTDNFQAAESLTHERLPEKWVAQINQRIALKRLGFIFRSGLSGEKMAVKKLDKVYRFFETSSIFDQDETRQMFLAQLSQTRERWKAMTWEEIQAETIDKA